MILPFEKEHRKKIYYHDFDLRIEMVKAYAKQTKEQFDFRDRNFEAAINTFSRHLYILAKMIEEYPEDYIIYKLSR